MVLLASHFIILQAIFQNILYIHQPHNAQEVFACFDVDGKRNDTWPSSWVRMRSYTDIGVPTFMAPVLNDTIQYKLRIRFQDGSVGDTDWKKLNITSCPTPQPSTSKTIVISEDYKDANFQSTSALLYYITTCSSLLTAKCMIKSIHKMFKKPQRTVY